jgi:hypothetical protein
MHAERRESEWARRRRERMGEELVVFESIYAEADAMMLAAVSGVRAVSLREGLASS